MLAFAHLPMQVFRSMPWPPASPATLRRPYERDSDVSRPSSLRQVPVGPGHHRPHRAYSIICLSSRQA
ncbi:hypothetical protein COY28_03890, partial [Candidatus Woesearchaeota archaeon CG_4_10_14_0_2_um_filter_57_5]